MKVEGTEEKMKPSPPPPPPPDAKTPRFISFIGNLPYTAPSPVGIMRRNNLTKCKGFAFAEFPRYDPLGLCLTRFYHSFFDDAISPARKIYVELTYFSPPPPLPSH